MPGKGPSNMQNYVHKRNSGTDSAGHGNKPATKGSNEDLKAHVPKTPAAPNSRQTRGNSQQSGQAASHQAQRDHQKGQHELHEGRAFYETDASSIDDTSIATNEQQAVVAAARAAYHEEGRGHNEESDGVTDVENAGSGSGEGSEDEPVVHSVRVINGVAVSSKQQQIMKDISRQKKTVGGHSLPYIQGDSYPTTTSGRPSIADSDPRGNQAHNARATHQQAEQPVTRPRSVDSPVHNQASQPLLVAYQDQNPNSKPLLSRPDGQSVAYNIQQMDDGFYWPKPKDQKLAIHQASRHQASGGHATHSSVSTNNIAKPPSAPRRDDGSRRAPQRQRLDDAPAKPKEEVSRGGQPPVAPLQPPTMATKQQQHRAESVLRPPGGEQLSDREHSPEDDRGASPTVQAERQLDYDTPTLFGMDYENLRKDSFDVDPNKEGLAIPDVDHEASLDTKLPALITLMPQAQDEFFTSIPMTEWEEAGDWFLTQFGNLLGKLKHARQEKRKAAKSFEDEIERRHSAVSRKRKQMEEELGAMKKSGGQVLQGTPKKKRTE